MATPMIILYNISILFAWRVTIKRERKAKAIQDRLDREEAQAKARRMAKKAARMSEETDEEEDEEEEDVVRKVPPKGEDD
jgi:Sec-independent protein secretion pathway component TatC